MGIIQTIPSRVINTLMIVSLNINTVVLIIIDGPSLYKNLTFSPDIKNDCYDIISSVQKMNRICVIYYYDNIIYGIKYNDEPLTYLSHKLQPTTFGHVLQ